MINSKTIAFGLVKGVAILVLVALALYFLYLIQSIIIYLVVSLILTLIGNPILDFLKRRLKFNHLFATLITLLFFLLIIAGLIMLFIPLILDQGKNLSLLNTSEIEKDILLLKNQFAAFLDSHNIDSANFFSDANIPSELNFSFLTNFFNSIIAGGGSIES